MNNLLCHTGRIFTLDELDGQAKAAPESMPRELTESLEDEKKTTCRTDCLSSSGQPVDAFQLWRDAWTVRRHT